MYGVRPSAECFLALGCVLALMLLATPAPAQAPRDGSKEGWAATVAPIDSPPPATPPAAAPPAPSIASGFEVSGTASRSRVLLELTGAPSVSVFRLSNPWRVVADVSNAELVRPIGPVGNDGGLIAGLRAGLFAPGKLRIVIDTTGPMSIESSRIIAATASTPSRLEIIIVPGLGSGSRASEIAAAAQSLPVDVAGSGDAPKARDARTKPVVIIDPGHGGIDPGARGEVGVEKDIVLAVSSEVRRALLATRRFDVVMTRTSDVFIPLDQRVQISRQHNADLFLSIHADSLDSKTLAKTVRGATVYTLSDKASDARAQAMADKENASDVLAGLPMRPGEEDEHVRDILVDLMRRESANLSADFRNLLVGEMRPRLAMARDPFRSAPFRVLRQPGSPAVLIELGYISNASDEKLMLTQAWQRTVAASITTAIEAYFARRSSAAR